MAKYVVAVSGGVDSIALLDMLSRVPGHDIVVAHFDHGIRDDSADDARFVELLAKKYGYAFETRSESLGPHASEELARDRRYNFLRNVASRHQAKLVTAHHADDAVETIAINVYRGTGWRGLAVMDSDVSRPLITVHKKDLIDYAHRRQLQWRDDSTNRSDAYLRNRIRHHTSTLDDHAKEKLLVLRQQQIAIKRQIDEEVRRLVGVGPDYSRYFFTHIPNVVAIECLRALTRGHLTRPRLEKVLLAIKTAQPRSVYQAGSGVSLHFTSRNFSFSLVK